MRAARGRARTERVLRVYGSQAERATGRRDERCKKRRKIKRSSIHREGTSSRNDRQWRSRGGASTRRDTRVCTYAWTRVARVCVDLLSPALRAGVPPGPGQGGVEENGPV